MNYSQLSRAELLAHKAELEKALEAKPEWVPKAGELVEVSLFKDFKAYTVGKYSHKASCEDGDMIYFVSDCVIGGIFARPHRPAVKLVRLIPCEPHH